MATAFGSPLIYAQEQKPTTELNQRHIIGFDYSPILRRSFRNLESSSYYKGIEVGLSYEYRLNHKFSILSGIGYYSQKNTQIIYGQPRESIQESLQIPFGFRYYFLKMDSKLQLYTDLVYKIRFSDEQGQVRLKGGEGNLSFGASYDIGRRLRVSSNIGIGYGGVNGFHLQPKFGLQLKL